MNEYTFTLRFRLSDERADPEHHLGSLLRAGCDDATVGVGLAGRVALMFARRSTSKRNAILSAIRDVRTGIPGAQLISRSL